MTAMTLKFELKKLRQIYVLVFMIYTR